MRDKKIRALTGNLIRLEEALKQFNRRRSIFINALNELSKDDNTKSKNSAYIKQLQEKIYYLDESIKAYRKHADECKSLLVREREIQTKEKKPAADGISKRTLIKYALPFVMLMIVFSSVFLLKPSITGQVILSKETVHNKSMNLEINQSGNYTWTFDKPVDISSVKASGSVTGNGTVKIYIEKYGKRHLIYKNK
ncbi:hypothetical protein HYW20_00045 [Candidatus Woesearchaeota archaeon]|nr:hypothetical protein [Candidatus Woesearchaeota archaeon]